MTLSGKTTLYKHPKAHTMYCSIPSMMVQDSQFNWKAGDRVRVWIDTLDGSLRMRRLVDEEEVK